MREGLTEMKSSPPLSRFLQPGNLLLVGGCFTALTVIANAVVRFICDRVVSFDCPTHWPVSMFLFRTPNWKHLLLAIAVVILFGAAVRYLSRVRYRLYLVILISIVLVLFTNLMQGWEKGFMEPIIHGGEQGIQYYHDAKNIEDPFSFLAQYEERQPTLNRHARTHPPGAVLTVYLLMTGLENPGLVSLTIAVVSVLLSGVFLFKFLSMYFKEHPHPGFVTFLFLLVPAVQIYSLASIDALVACFLLGVLYYFHHPRLLSGIIGSVICLFLSSFLTFAFLFIIPILAISELMGKKRPWRTGAVLLGLFLIYIIIFTVFGFNYRESFLIASALENPDGFRLISEPVSYIFSRVEGVFEIILFLGPFLTLLCLRGLRIRKKFSNHLLDISWLAVLTLAAMLLTGAFRTGETARACLFIYPYLVFPAAVCISEYGVTRKEETRLLWLVFGQTVLMQMFGYYFW